MLLSSACVYKQSEDPSVVDAISDTVKRHPNLTEVTVSEEKFGSRSLSIGVVKGVKGRCSESGIDDVQAFVP